LLTKEDNQENALIINKKGGSQGGINHPKKMTIKRRWGSLIEEGALKRRH
jgi:hypothetical protein